MENASKALLMAGGILIALLVIGALLLMFNQVGEYQRSQDTNKRTSQLAEFNLDFERYTDDKGIKGTDIISLINKVIDYNKKAKNGGVNNSVDYNIKMSITVSGLDQFKIKYPVESGITPLFSNDKLVIKENNSNNSFKEMISVYSQYEDTYSLSVMNSLSSNYKEIKNKANGLNEQGYKILIKEFTGKDINNPPDLKQIGQYRQYSEFKTAKFKLDETATNKGIFYENGQIRDLYFIFDK